MQGILNSLLLLGVATTLFAAEPHPDFAAEVRPLLEKHCVACHGPDKQKGKVRFDTLSTDFVGNRAAAETWHDAHDLIRLGEMPPEDEPALSREARSVITRWIEGELAKANRKQSPTAESTGTVLRRLNRDEYHYTMLDLLGFDMDYRGNLPPDPISADGFRNNGSALGTSGLQLESWLETARTALGYILQSGEPPPSEPELITHNPKQRLRIRVTGNNSNRLGRVHYWAGTSNRMPSRGPFTIRIRARAEQTPGQPPPVLKVDYGYTVSGLTVSFLEALETRTVTNTNLHEIIIRGRAEFSPRPSSSIDPNKLQAIILLTNALDDGIPPPKEIRKKGRKGPKHYPEDPQFAKIQIESVTFTPHDYPEWPPAEHRRIVPADEDLTTPASIRRVLLPFLARAWRRPVSNAEAKTWLSHYETIRKSGMVPIDALRETLAASLASANFLYLQEPHAGGTVGIKLSPHELATRLSYFLWSGPPDAVLRRCADDGSLLEPAVLTREFERLLNHPRSERFVRHFTGQWLDHDALERIAINPQYYKQFDNRLKPMMAEESWRFFDEVLRNDLSAVHFLDADFTMANAALARHYGLEPPPSQDFQRVSLADSKRPGGILGHGATHLAGSDGVDSHPILRAVWIRERLLHDPPDPPPPNVPELDESVPNSNKLSIREQLLAHRENPACNDCHSTLDPWGIALEEFDPTGLFRTKTARNRTPVSSSTVLPGKHEVNGVADLQRVLLDARRDQFFHALTSKLSSYALGRSLTFEDEPLLDELEQKFSADGYRLRPLLRAIIRSNAFRSK